VYKKISLTALSSAVLLMSGCAGFPANNLSKVSAENLHFASAAKTRVFSRWSLDKTSGMNDQTSAAIAAVNKNTLTMHCTTLIAAPS
jgi:hypothetical protein